MIDFSCPHCNNSLTVNNQLVFSVEKKNKRKGLVILSSELGDYSAFKCNGFNVEKGESIFFYCPICMHSLMYKNNPSLVHITRIENEFKKKLLFSSVFGEKITYEISENNIMAYGEHAARYQEMLKKNYLYRNYDD